MADRVVTETESRPTEVREVREAAPAGPSGGVVGKRIVYYIGGVIMALIALRFVFLLLGANRDAGFVDFIYNLSAIFVAPFTGIFGEPTFGQSYFESSSLVALIVYGLLTVGIGKLMTLGSSRRV